MRTPTLWPLITLCLLTLPAPSPGADEAVSFRHEVMAVLSRAGCNSGACHGNLNGKNGFKLSLRGEDPAFDLTALTRQMNGRRLSLHAPDSSLVLAKAVSSIPHEGGQRFGRSSREYQLLRRWIAEGARDDRPGLPTLTKLTVSPTESYLVEPQRSLKVTVTARFSDGRERDVTGLSVFEASNPIVRVAPDGTVTATQAGETTLVVRYLERQTPIRLAFVPSRPGFVWQPPPALNTIDTHVDAKLRRLRINPSELCDDATFLRRAYLDTLGRTPSVEEARRFLASTDTTRRRKLIDELLAHEEFADFWALKWADLLRNEEKTLDRKGVQLFQDWIRRSLAQGKPLNEFARELIAGRGSSYGNPEANYYRALRDPATRAETTAQVFLGVRLQCARCHNHPFDSWTQNDYHSLAAFFVRIQYRVVENNRRDRLDKHEFDGEQIVFQTRSGELNHPVSGEPLRPRLLGAPTPRLDESADRLTVLADWVAAPDNPFFARAQANRIWYHLMGRGLVEPNDDFRVSNPAVNGPLLEALAKDLAEHRFDLRHLVRTIMNSRTYQASYRANDSNADDETNFSHVEPRPLQAEPLLDSIAQALGVAPSFVGHREGLRAVQVPGVQARRARDGGGGEGERFLVAFGKPMRLLNCECERSGDTTLGQALNLITGRLLHEMLSQDDNRLGKLLAASASNEEMVEELYLATLSRRPTERERSRAAELLTRAKDRRAALEDLAWALVNAKEFLLRR